MTCRTLGRDGSQGTECCHPILLWYQGLKKGCWHAAEATHPAFKAAVYFLLSLILLSLMNLGCVYKKNPIQETYTHEASAHFGTRSLVYSEWNPGKLPII